LPKTGRVLLTVDAAYTMDHWEEKALPGFMVSAMDAVRSVQKLRALADKTNALVVTGHDPDAWPHFRHAPGLTNSGRAQQSALTTGVENRVSQ
jgi:N-acyl homoserine lactone hydrolase